MAKIIIIEDEESYRDPLAFSLNRDGFSVETAEDGLTGIDIALSQKFDLVVLDVMLPGISGMEVCKRIRKVTDTPIIMVTAKDDVIDRILGLELGADDYITKPYSYREILARVKAILRREARTVQNRNQNPGDKTILKVGSLELDAQAYKVSLDGKELNLPLREFEILEYLMLNEGRVITRAQIIDEIWGVDYEGDSKTLDVHVKRIRSKIEKNPAQPEIITTVRGLGYKIG